MNLFLTSTIVTDQNPAEFVLEGQEAHHASQVLRIGEGEKIHATDGKGTIYSGKVIQISKGQLRADIVSHISYPKPIPEIMLAIGHIKKRDRMEFAVEKAVEMGVTELIIYQGDRSIKKGLRTDRLQATALSAMKQSLRAWTPSVRKSKNLVSVLDEADPVRTIVADEHKPYFPAQSLNWKGENKLLFIVGPEGGFSEEELQILEQRDIETVSLGSHRLRTETAAIAIASFFLK